MWVACLRFAEYFADEVDGSLHFVDVTWLIALDDQDGAHNISCGGSVQEDFPVFWCSEDTWRGEKILELLECFGSTVVPLKLIGLP